MAKIKMHNSSPTCEEVFKEFLADRQAKGLSAKTLQTYSYHFSAIGKYFDVSCPIEYLTKHDMDNMINSMVGNISANSINSYTRTLKSFLSWCNELNYTSVNIKLYKAEEVIKDTYTDEELRLLLIKPNMRKCDFSEYRNWVIINLLLNSGMRAATLRNILIKDVNLTSNTILYRHTKNGKIQIVPLCTEMTLILKEYLRVRGGNEDSYLFPSITDTQLTESGLNEGIAAYNKSRGVKKTSIHLFRHTFAERYLRNGGNAFNLQKLLGHSTLNMTKHYCNIYNADLSRDYDTFSPLAQLSTKRKKISMRQSMHRLWRRFCCACKKHQKLQVRRVSTH